MSDEAVEAMGRKVAGWPRDNYGRPYIYDFPGGQEAALRELLEAARPFMTSRLALDRDVLEEALRPVAHGPRGPLIDKLMTLVVPVPTREEIERAIVSGANNNAWPFDTLDEWPAGARQRLRAQADAVLALLDGSAK